MTVATINDDDVRGALLAPGIDVAGWTDALVLAVRIAEQVHDTEFVPKALRGRPEAVAAVVMYGFETGVPAMQALAGIHIVEGRPAPSAELMRAMILRAGHTLSVHEMSGTRARVSGLRRGHPESDRVVVEWTMDQARAAGLAGKSNWRSYPRAMLLARATGDLARLVFPDVVKGLGYVAEDASVQDLDGWPATDPQSPPPPVEPRKLQRRRRPKVTADAPTDVPVGDDRGDVSPRPVPEPEPDGPGPDDVPLPDMPPAPPEPPPLPPEVVADALVEVRADVAQRAGAPPLPPLEPEGTPDEPPAVGPKLIGPGQLKAVQASLTAELGTVATREEKHAMLAAILGHPVESTKDLTREEAFTVLDVTGRFADGTARWEPDLATGGFTIHTTTDEGGTE